MVPLSLAGLFSGLLTAFCSKSGGQLWNALLPGVAFGALISGGLVMCGILQSIGKATRIIALTIAAYIVSNLVATAVQLALLPFIPESQQWSMGHPMTESPIAVFAGGAIGGFLILYGIVILLHPKTERRGLEAKILLCSSASGALGVIGWALGPSLGMALWSVSHALHLTAPTETYQNAAYGGTGYQYSLYPVWQSGTAVLLGVLLRRYEAKPPSKELENP